MVNCKQCLHFEACDSMYRALFNTEWHPFMICDHFKDRTKLVTRAEAKWIDHGYGVECPICNHQVNDEYYLGDAVSCPNCGALLQPAE